MTGASGCVGQYISRWLLDLPGTPEENGEAFFRAGKSVMDRLGAVV